MKKWYMLLVFVITAVGATALIVSQAGALPQYATDTGLACGSCHVNPAGGGTLTSLGTAFLNNGHKLPTTTQATAPTTTQATAPTTTQTTAPTTTNTTQKTTTTTAATTTTTAAATTTTTAGPGGTPPSGPTTVSNDDSATSDSSAIDDSNESARAGEGGRTETETGDDTAGEQHDTAQLQKAVDSSARRTWFAHSQQEHASDRTASTRNSHGD